MGTRIDLLTQQISQLTRERDVAQERSARLEKELLCSRVHPDRPLQDHRASTVCTVCYETLRGEYARSSLVAASIAGVVLTWMRDGRECPFCGQVVRHKDTCYLSLDAGFTLLQEYTAIEQHRDLLLADRMRTNGGTAVVESTVRVRLKERFRLHHTNGNGHPVPPSR